jgi:predicted transport protein
MGLAPKEQEKVYCDYWYPMEQLFDQDAQPDLFDRFMRDYLTLKSRVGTIPNIRDVYTSFKSYIQRQKGVSIRESMADVYRYAKHYAKLVLGHESDSTVQQALQDINTLKVDVAYPFLLEVYDDYAQKIITRDDFIGILRLVESYVFRRAIAGVPTNSMNKIFATLSREIDRDHYLESVQLAFICKDAQRRFPDDNEFRREFVVKDIYRFRNRNYLLRKLENYKRPKELVDPENYTIEHILPQNPKLSPEWQTALGENWQKIQATHLHTIGNLTLTAYNAEYSDRTFPDKRDMDGGFKVSPLHLNQGLAHLENWGESEIKDRAAELASWAVNIWAYPTDVAQPVGTTVQSAIQNVFLTQADLNKAKTYVQEVVDLIGYDQSEHILAITHRNDQAISVNLGQWVVLRFQRKDDELTAFFAVDFSEETQFDSIQIQGAESFSTRWAGEKDIRLVWLPWNSETPLPESFIQAWKSAICHAYQTFKGWATSSYKNYHSSELAQALVAETARSRHAEYLQGEMLVLFEALSKRILNLDSSVRQEFKKLYVAYKTTTNFVDIVPQKSRLRLSLNMRFEEVNDPQELCRDITDLGRWGNGDVEVGISSLDQLDDIMFLIRQAFEKHREEVSL